MGPMTGRGLGDCAGRGFGGGGGRGRGFGGGFGGAGRGFGRGYGRRFDGFHEGPQFETGDAITSSLADEVIRLKDQLRALEERLADQNQNG